MGQNWKNELNLKFLHETGETVVSDSLLLEQVLEAIHWIVFEDRSFISDERNVGREIKFTPTIGDLYTTEQMKLPFKSMNNFGDFRESPSAVIQSLLKRKRSTR